MEEAGQLGYRCVEVEMSIAPGGSLGRKEGRTGMNRSRKGFVWEN